QLCEAAGGSDLPAIERGFKSRWFELLARAEIELGQLDAASDWVERAEDAASGLDIGGRTADALRARARLLLAQRDPAAAALLALQAAETADAAGVCVDAARSRILAGIALGE